MKPRTLIVSLVGVLVILGLGVTGYFTRDHWLALVKPAPAGPSEEPHDHAAHADRIKLSPEARDNLKLVVKPLALQSYWRTLSVPGIIIDRPGISDRGVTAPVAAVVSKVHAFPGDTVKPGDALFTLRLVSEVLQTSQAELFKTTQEQKLTQEQLDRLRPLARSGAIPEARVIDLESQQRRLITQALSYRQELLTRGLTNEQIDEAAQGKFIKEITLVAPKPLADVPVLVSGRNAGSPSGEGNGHTYEVQEMKVQLGEQVQAGQVLGVLANHGYLYIEGHGFKKEAGLLERAAQKGWPIEAEFPEDDSQAWPPLEQALQIRHLANMVDPESRTFGFFIPLVNQSRAYEKDGQTFLVWRFRPGQRVRLHVPVAEFKDAMVLPAAAVAKEGPEAYVFRANGDAFDRKPVRILFEDRRHVVIAGDEVTPGQHVAQNGAAALNRALKAQQSGGEGGHDHHGHDH